MGGPDEGGGGAAAADALVASGGASGSGARPRAEPSAADAREPCAADVWVHVYHCDPVTGYLNQAMLAAREIGIYHAGVEVFGWEWCFQYYEDSWDDPSISGIVRCRPRQMEDYEYQESVNLGPTPLSRYEVSELLDQLHMEWPASSYHLTRHNCLTFAEAMVGQLGAPGQFPARLRGVLEASASYSAVDAVVDYSWSWVKWWQRRKTRQEQEQDRAAASSAGFEQQQQASWWALLANPTSTCSTLCATGPGPNRSGVDLLEPVPSEDLTGGRPEHAVAGTELRG